MNLKQFSIEIDRIFSSSNLLEQFIVDIESFYKALDDMAMPLFLIKPIILKVIKKKSSFKVKKSFYQTFVEIAKKNRSNAFTKSCEQASVSLEDTDVEVEVDFDLGIESLISPEFSSGESEDEVCFLFKYLSYLINKHMLF